MALGRAGFIRGFFKLVQVPDLALPPAGAQLQPRELLHQRRAIGIAVAVRQIAAVRTGEDGGQLLQREQLRVEGVDKGIHRFLEVAQLNVVVALGHVSQAFAQSGRARGGFFTNVTRRARRALTFQCEVPSWLRSAA